MTRLFDQFRARTPSLTKGSLKYCIFRIARFGTPLGGGQEGVSIIMGPQCRPQDTTIRTIGTPRKGRNFSNNLYMQDFLWYLTLQPTSFLGWGRQTFGTRKSEVSKCSWNPGTLKASSFNTRIPEYKALGHKATGTSCLVQPLTATPSVPP